ncbi:copper resistance CopC family protein [Corynebacterium uterequi]|uniref:Copper resistance protein CopC-like protein n=1 Tax=Corynebacterium uterequi TaxID=1072256 RepID=A0A0G3HD73_9CORY|nr:copper resistance CopC family protein [Corynebacterium uterequi]AKK11249.1 copper resistance protein CopC-like protein [Corynebacterium uterequi]
MQHFGTVIRRTPRSVAVVLGVMAGLAVGAGDVAQAHDVVIGGNPAHEAHLEEFPEQLTLEFSAEPLEGFNTFALSNVDTNEVLFTGEPEINGRELTVSLPDGFDPGDGQYRIGFQITSSDGHATRGMTTFSVGDAEAAPVGDAEAAPGGETASPTDGQADSEAAGQEENTSPSAFPASTVAVGVAVLAAVGVVGLVVKKRRRTASS